MATNPFCRLMEVLAGASQAQLRRQVQYLKAENQVLRSKVKGQVRVSPRERARLVHLAKPLLGPALKSLVSIVKPETMRRWIRDARRGSKRRGKTGRRPGRPRTPAEVRTLILRMARENAWGYTRILGELKKLGITVARGTVANILKETGVPTGPARGESTWDEFLRRHAKTLWACDFVHVRTLTLRGFRRAYALVFIHPHSRRVVVSPSTFAPNAAWVTEQARAFAKTAGATSSSGGIDRPRILLRDSDTKFAAGFVEAMRGAGIRTKRLPHRAPNLNAYAERFIQTLRTECLDRFIVCGTGHLDHLTSEFVEHYLHERPHMSLGLRCPAGPPARFAGQAPVRPSEIVCQQRLGGVLRHYHRKKAA